MVVPRTPRPPIIVPKPPERTLDTDEIERWVARLARSIRLKRLEQGFLGGSVKAGAADAADGSAESR
jgi:hypothetical protein